jgi:ABC-type multidrug transport system ATPase subunit
VREVILLSGPNFSGRSDSLRDWLCAERDAGPVVFIGPSVASALTGLGPTVGAELDLYRSWNAPPPHEELAAFLDPRSDQSVTSLSGGEQVLLALVLAARPDAKGVALDCALEQLDDDWRRWAVSYVRSAPGGAEVRLADNQMLSERDAYDRVLPMPDATGAFRMGPADESLASLQAIRPAHLTVEGLSFRYPRGPVVFEGCSFELRPGRVYRLKGANGAGKSTLIRLLCGVLPMSRGTLSINGAPYRPYREGNRLVALSMQNPDDQWSDISLFGDLGRRLRHLSSPASAAPRSPERLASTWGDVFAVRDRLHEHVLDFPRVLRKRLSWIWPLSGCLPWLVFDEPTLGQDDSTVTRLISLLRFYVKLGYGVLYVSHDRRLSDGIRATQLLIEDRGVTGGS